MTLGFEDLEKRAAEIAAETADADKDQIEALNAELDSIEERKKALNIEVEKRKKDAEAVANGKYVTAICAAPSVLGEMGLLRGKEAVCYPGFENKLTGARLSTSKVVLDNKILTAAGMGVAQELGLKIVEIFCGKEKASEIRHAIIAD